MKLIKILNCKRMSKIMLVVILLLPFIELNAQSFQEFMQKNNSRIWARINIYDPDRDNLLIERRLIEMTDSIEAINILGSVWSITKKVKPLNKKGVFEIELNYRCIEGKLMNASLTVDFSFDNWSDDNYVLMPAAVYNGNRVKSVRHSYPPFFFDIRDIGPNAPQIISDIPRLNVNSGSSRIQQRTGDMSTPSIGFYDSRLKQGFFLLAGQMTRLGDSGIDIEENKDHSRAVISITAPVVREQYRYYIADMRMPSNDAPVDFIKGDKLTIPLKIYWFPASTRQNLFDYFAEIRRDMLPVGKHKPSIPFSEAFRIIEGKFNQQNFESRWGYYSVGLRENCFQDWQIGWVGGMMSTYPLYIKGNEVTRQNVIRNFNWVFPNGISPSGYFWDTGHRGDIWFGIFQSSPVMKDWHLVRKSGDGLYYVLKQLYLFEKNGITIEPAWADGARKVADAFVKTWKEYGQLGQYVNNITGEIVLGGSTSGGIVPAALILASDYYKNNEYLKIAEDIADYYDENYVQKCITYGGPGDALGNFDSESAYGLLESYTLLFEVTNNQHWLDIAKNLAKQFSSWVQSYNYVFPENSTLGKLGKTTTGVVWANTQNKHGAPGICTHSGLALLRLYRATGDKFYAELLKDITNAIPQYLSTTKQPIKELENGWISERVSTTDWLEGIGEIFHGSTWSETSLMLTVSEIPGIYIAPDLNEVFSFDQVSAKIISSSLKVRLSNLTNYDADVYVMIEKSKDRIKPLGIIPDYMNHKVFIEAGATRIITINK